MTCLQIHWPFIISVLPPHVSNELFIFVIDFLVIKFPLVSSLYHLYLDIFCVNSNICVILPLMSIDRLFLRETRFLSFFMRQVIFVFILMLSTIPQEALGLVYVSSAGCDSHVNLSPCGAVSVSVM